MKWLSLHEVKYFLNLLIYFSKENIIHCKSLNCMNVHSEMLEMQVTPCSVPLYIDLLLVSDIVPQAMISLLIWFV